MPRPLSIDGSKSGTAAKMHDLQRIPHVNWTLAQTGATPDVIYHNYTKWAAEPSILFIFSEVDMTVLKHTLV